MILSFKMQGWRIMSWYGANNRIAINVLYFFCKKVYKRFVYDMKKILNLERRKTDIRN